MSRRQRRPPTTMNTNVPAVEARFAKLRLWRCRSRSMRRESVDGEGVQRNEVGLCPRPPVTSCPGRSTRPCCPYGSCLTSHARGLHPPHRYTLLSMIPRSSQGPCPGNHPPGRVARQVRRSVLALLNASKARSRARGRARRPSTKCSGTTTLSGKCEKSHPSI